METLRTLIYEIFLKTFNEKRKKINDIYIYIFFFTVLFFIFTIKIVSKFF